MTRIERIHSLTATQLRRRDFGTIAVTAIVAILAVHLWPTTKEARANDRAYQVLKAACHFPSKPGEATTYALTSDGKIYCWEMGR
jgi:hypothetical protein